MDICSYCKKEIKDDLTPQKRLSDKHRGKYCVCDIDNFEFTDHDYNGKYEEDKILKITDKVCVNEELGIYEEYGIGLEDIHTIQKI